MDNAIKERIKAYLTVKNITVNKIAKETGYPQANLQKQVNQSVALSGKTIAVILDYCKDLSAEWLLRGTGSMIKAPEGKTINIYRQGGDGDSQTNVVGDNNEISDKEALKMALQQNNKLIEALLNQK